MRSRLAGILAVTIASMGCEVLPGLSEADLASVRAVDDAYAAGVRAQDWAALVALFTPGVEYMPPNRDVILGRDANLARFRTRNWTSVEYTHVPIDIGGAGDVAYVRGTYTVGIVLPDALERVEDEGKYLAIVLRQPDGEWLIDKMIWSSVRRRS